MLFLSGAFVFITYAILSEILKLAGANQSAKIGRPWSSFCQILLCLLGCIVAGLQNLLKKTHLS